MNYKILYLPVFIFCIYFSGCETSKTLYVEPDKIPKEEIVRIKGIFLKNSGYIDVSEKNAVVELVSDSGGISYNANQKNRVFIRDDEIAGLKIEIVKNNYAVPFYILGGVILTFVILLIILGPPLPG